MNTRLPVGVLVLAIAGLLLARVTGLTGYFFPSPSDRAAQRSAPPQRPRQEARSDRRVLVCMRDNPYDFKTHMSRSDIEQRNAYREHMAQIARNMAATGDPFLTVPVASGAPIVLNAIAWDASITTFSKDKFDIVTMPPGATQACPSGSKPLGDDPWMTVATALINAAPPETPPPPPAPSDPSGGPGGSMPYVLTEYLCKFKNRDGTCRAYEFCTYKGPNGLHRRLSDAKELNAGREPDDLQCPYFKMMPGESDP